MHRQAIACEPRAEIPDGVSAFSLLINKKLYTMASKNLTFTKQDGEWVAKTSDGPGIVQLARAEQGTVSVSANISGMGAVPIASFKNPYMSDVIFKLEVPSGIEVTIKSATEVVEAKMFTE